MAELGPSTIYGDLIVNDDFYVKGSKGIHLNDVETRIWEDDDSNMTFKDEVAGTYTLQQLAIGEHNLLNGLQGGEADDPSLSEYYHLEYDQYKALLIVIGGPSNDADDYHTHSMISEHNLMSGLQGGNDDEYYHLTDAEYNTDFVNLTDGSNADALHSHAGAGSEHNNLNGLQGGEEDRYYHLSDDQFYGLIGGPSVNADEYHTHGFGELATMPTLKYIYDYSFKSESMKNANDSTNWGINQALIKIIKVETESTDWDLTLFCDTDEISGMFDAIDIVRRASGTQVIKLDLPYVDNNGTNSVHFRFTEHADPSGGGGRIDIYGLEATV